MKNKYKTKKRLYNKKNKTRRVNYGGAEEELKQEIESKQPRGIYSYIKDKVLEVSGDVAKYVGDKVALGAGYVPVEEIKNIQFKEDVVEDLPESSVEKITETGKEVAHKLAQSLEVFNKAVDTPELRQEISDTFNSVSDVATIGMKALDKPINEAAEKVGEIVKKVTPDVVEAGVNAGFSAAKAIPGIGSAISIGSMINNISEGAASVVKAGTEATEVTADLVKDTLIAFKDEKEKFEKEKELEKLFDDKKKEGEDISNRISNSIEKFEETNKISNTELPSKINNQNIAEKSLQGGNRKHTRKLLKRKHKSAKRVRFMM